jgi:hypothetical protein
VHHILNKIGWVSVVWNVDILYTAGPHKFRPRPSLIGAEIQPPVGTGLGEHLRYPFLRWPDEASVVLSYRARQIASRVNPVKTAVVGSENHNFRADGRQSTLVKDDVVADGADVEFACGRLAGCGNYVIDLLRI